MTRKYFEAEKEARNFYQELISQKNRYCDVKWRGQDSKGRWQVHYHHTNPQIKARKELAHELKKRFGEHHISVEGEGRGNNLPISQKGEPTRKESLYRPDIMICEDKGSKRNIWCIVEIETGAGKSIPGAMVLADYCIKQHRKIGLQDEGIRPRIFFVTLKDTELVRKRISAVKKYCSNVLIDENDAFSKQEAVEKVNFWLKAKRLINF